MAQNKERVFNDDPYLRAEHLLQNGRYRAVTVTVTEIVTKCPIKKGDKDAATFGLAFANSDKVLGLNTTNKGLMAIQTGEGDPFKWVGHKVQLVVRLVRNKKLEEPAIRVWPDKPVPNARLRDQMGKEIEDKWYEDQKFKSEPQGESA